MTYKEYLKESERLKDENKSFIRFCIIFAIILLLSSMFICTDKCSDSVFELVFTLNSIIWGLFCYIHSLKERNIELKLKVLSQQLDKEDMVFYLVSEKIKQSPF